MATLETAEYRDLLEAEDGRAGPTGILRICVHSLHDLLRTKHTSDHSILLANVVVSGTNAWSSHAVVNDGQASWNAVLKFGITAVALKHHPFNMVKISFYSCSGDPNTRQHDTNVSMAASMHEVGTAVFHTFDSILRSGEMLTGVQLL